LVGDELREPVAVVLRSRPVTCRSPRSSSRPGSE
jgi:hypothetical protein